MVITRSSLAFCVAGLGCGLRVLSRGFSIWRVEFKGWRLEFGGGSSGFEGWQLVVGGRWSVRLAVARSRPASSTSTPSVHLAAHETLDI